MGITEEEYAQLLQNRATARQEAPGATIATPAKKRAKYGNKTVLVDLGPSGEVVGGKLRLVHTFDSQREADYYQELKARRAAGQIDGLELQKSYALIVHAPRTLANAWPAIIVGYYEADFTFFELNPERRHRVVDVKGMKTQVYALKKRIVEACHALTIDEV